MNKRINEEQKNKKKDEKIKKKDEEIKKKDEENKNLTTVIRHNQPRVDLALKSGKALYKDLVKNKTFEELGIRWYYQR